MNIDLKYGNIEITDEFVMIFTNENGIKIKSKIDLDVIVKLAYNLESKNYSDIIWSNGSIAFETDIEYIDENGDVKKHKENNNAIQLQFYNNNDLLYLIVLKKEYGKIISAFNDFENDKLNEYLGN